MADRAQHCKETKPKTYHKLSTCERLSPRSGSRGCLKGACREPCVTQRIRNMSTRTVWMSCWPSACRRWVPRVLHVGRVGANAANMWGWCRANVNNIADTSLRGMVVPRNINPKKRTHTQSCKYSDACSNIIATKAVRNYRNINVCDGAAKRVHFVSCALYTYIHICVCICIPTY